MNERKNKPHTHTIALNKKARHDYFIEERFEAGIALQGWEVKSLRSGHAQLKEAYVTVRKTEVFLVGAHISPLSSASTHIRPDPRRTRKLLLHHEEIRKLVGAVDRRGYTLVPLAMYWKRGRAKLEIALAKGKHKHDKRSAIRQREAEREQQRALKAVRGKG
ncbi:MAG: SsrA-binding protein SmpB [Acidiferrobacterales bacterium]|jgi:SsrA-binding protein|nr:SsrA-binding protein SmpB [Nitrospira sp.]MCZ6575850.1 SsrA-binding protein SmpB [Gammaproteobacteria bacterium]